MKKTQFLFVPFLLLLACSALRCSAQQAVLSPAATKTVHAIRAEADAARHNATIYQWQRVNREIDRIISEARHLSSEPSASTTRDDIQKAIQDLRAARLRHNVNDIVDATTRLIADCNILLHL